MVKKPQAARAAFTTLSQINLWRILEEACVLTVNIQLRAADGSLIDTISPQRLQRLTSLGMVMRTNKDRHGVEKSAVLFARPGESVLDRLKMQAYSFQERIDIYRIWKLMHIAKADRCVFQMSITDNLVYVDPSTGQKRAAA